jgi:hypothetical protein
MYREYEYERFKNACFAAACSTLQGAVLTNARRGDPFTRVNGLFAGRPAEVRMCHVSVKGSGQNLQTYVKAPATFAGIELAVRPKDDREIGQQLLLDLELGDPAFDAYFLVDGAPTEAIRALVDPALRVRLVQLTNECDPGWSTDRVGLSVTDDGVTLAYAGGIHDPAYLAGILQAVTSVASRVPPIMASLRDRTTADAQVADLRARRHAQWRRGTITLILVLLGIALVIGGIVYAFATVRITV